MKIELMDENYEYDIDQECDHDEYEIDFLTGRAECSFCPHTWYVTDEQIRQEMDRQATYHHDMDRENRRQWWRDFWLNLREPLRRLARRNRVTVDDEIPF